MIDTAPHTLPLLLRLTRRFVEFHAESALGLAEADGFAPPGTLRALLEEVATATGGRFPDAVLERLSRSAADGVARNAGNAQHEAPGEKPGR